MSDVVIKIENLAKIYRLGLVSTKTVSHDLNRFWNKVRGKEDPYLKIGEVNDRTLKSDSDYIWALKDINLEIRQGERVGIIGKNGAGKSTLLKIISEVTGPTKGCIKMNGRVGSLLEVGTGFHPELTGRENIYMNGTILGMSHREVSKKLDEIIDFAGVERYIDTPVKRYSSGMMVRLGFAVAAHLEPDILLVDEVLAVGDAEFQKKAIGKMQQVSEGHGRTILFVSHNMGAVARLCTKGCLISNGEVCSFGKVESIIGKYQEISFGCIAHTYDIPKPINVPIYFNRMQIVDLQGNLRSSFAVGEPYKFKLFFEAEEPLKDIVVGIGFVNNMGTPVHTTWAKPQSFDKGKYLAEFSNSEVFLTTGIYKACIGISKLGNLNYHYCNDVGFFEILDSKTVEGVMRTDIGIYINPMQVKITENN